MHLRQSEFDSNKAMIKDFRTKNRACVKYLGLLAIDWPCAIDMIDRVIDDLSDQLCILKTPIIYRAISNGLSRYGRSFGESDPKRLLFFIEGITDSLGQDLSNYSVFDKKSNNAWSPLGNEPLAQWLKNIDGELSSLELIESSSSMKDISVVFMRRLITEQIKNVIEDEVSCQM